jgi:hypothetical protein
VSLGRPPVGQARLLMVRTRAKYHYGVRSVRLRKAEIKRQRLLKEMKTIKGDNKSRTLPDQVGEARGEEEIIEGFRKVYKDLYNSLDDSEILRKFMDEVETKANSEESKEEASKITGEAVKAAVRRLRAGKGDITGSYTFKCWATSVKLSWECVPRSCHRWLVDSLLCCGLSSSRQHHLAMYAGFFRRLHTSSVPEVRQMAHYCLSDMRTNTARNITRICRELNLTVSTVTPEAVRRAWQPRTCLPDDQWKVGVLWTLLEEWLDLKAAGEEEEEQGRTLSHYIHIICEM